MTHPILAVFALFFFVLGSLQGQTPADQPSLDKILSSYYQAMGGLASIENLGSIRIKATIERPQKNIEAIIIKKKPNKVRITFDIDSQILVHAYDGNLPWTIPFGSSWIDARVMSDLEAKSLIRDAPIESALVNWKDKNIKLDYKGVVKVDNLFDCHQIDALLPDGTFMSFHLDVTTFHERKIITRETLSDGRVVEQESIPSEYKMHQRVLIAHKVVNRVNGKYDSTIRVTDVAINPGVLDSYFTFPKRSK